MKAQKSLEKIFGSQKTPWVFCGNKKAFVFTLFVVLSTLLILMIGAASLYEKQGKFEGKIGKEDAAIITAYTETEKALFYLDMAAKITAYEALETLASKNTDCGSYSRIPIWVSENKKCYPNIIEDYKQLFNNLIEEKIEYFHTITFRSTRKPPLLPTDYELAFRTKNDKTTLVGTAKSGIIYYIDTDENIHYKTNSNFKVETNFNLDTLAVIPDTAIQFLIECSGVAEIDIGKCAGFLDEKWKIGNECMQNNPDDGLIPLCYTFQTNNPFTAKKHTVFRFAVPLAKTKLVSFCCSPDSLVEGLDCKKNAINGWWNTVDQCRRISHIQKFADWQENKVCCLS